MEQNALKWVRSRHPAEYSFLKRCALEHEEEILAF
jgi:hypothetical protein